MLLTTGARLGPYEIVDLLGSGGMGEVYRARDTRLKRQVAIKILPSISAADSHVRVRFDREARAVAALSHPNIVAIYDVGDHDGIAYAAIELLEGETLRSRLAQPLARDTALDVAVQICRGLEAAHERGIVHRDLKPENVFLTRGGQVKILDFGLATEPAEDTSDNRTQFAATEDGMMLGTAGYMSPEQVRGERADARSDVFSFGCVLYEMVANRRAFGGDGRVETLHAILKEDPPALASLDRTTPAALDRLVRRCLAKAPDHRFQTARDLNFALETVIDEGRGSATPSLLVAPADGRRLRAAVAVIAGAFLVGSAALWWKTAGDRRARATAGAAAVPGDSRPIVAVLPFEQIAGSSDGSFGAGMTEEVTNQLSKLSALRVIGRAAVGQFKNGRSDLPAIVRDLGVGSVVTGTVREAAARVRVNVELTDARSGQVIWAEQYDREGVDVFAAQSDIALRVADALKASVTLDEQTRVGKRPTSSVAAYQLFVRARGVDLKTAVELLNQAVALDPNFAEAYSALADRYYLQSAYGDLSATARGLAAANKALEIDPQLASGHHGLGLNLHQGGRLREALPEYRKAVALDPSYPEGLDDLAFGESTAGRFAEALTHAGRALTLTSNRPDAYYHVGVALLYLDDDELTERFLTMAEARFPAARRLVILHALLDLRRGQQEAALVRIRRAADAAPKNIEVLLTRAEVALFAAAPDAPAFVSGLLGTSADGLFSNAPYPVKLAHAYQLQQSGSKKEAASLLDEVLASNRVALTSGANWPMVFVQNAAVHALRGDAKASLDALDQAYAAGWRDERTMAIDPLLAPVRQEPRFVELLSRIRQDVAAMRARADYSFLP
jgi:TolB-like protein/Flp pilus assembly protein TadD